MEDKKDILSALKDLNTFNIKKNKNKKDLEKENPGWTESEEEYKEKQKEWLKKVNKKTK